MRFVLCIGIFTLLSTSSLAAPWDIVPTSDTERRTVSTPIQAIQMQRGGAPNALLTIDSLELEIFATGLGDISAMALSEDGTLFTSDRKSGRIWTLTDRRQDGKIDLRRPLPFTFDNPTGLCVMDGKIYVADRNAVWVIDAGQDPKELASLKHANSSGGPHILSAHADTEMITLGLTSQNQGFRVLALNKYSGQASLIAEDRNGQLQSLAQRAGSDIWIASGSTLGPIDGGPLSFNAGQSISAMALPGQYETPRDWPAQLDDHIIAAQTGPNAMQLIAIPTEFGQVSAAPRILVEGFLASSGRNAWGQPGPILMDKRGLFFADPNNGTIWRLSPKAKPKPKITTVDTASLPPAPSEEPSLASNSGALKIESSIKGTQIDASSTIIQPSSIEYGSKLIKDYDEKKAQEEAETAETEPKKKRRMSRKRKQKDE